MVASRESESPLPVERRQRGWWWRPLGWTLTALYGGQLVPFVVGPLTDCDHCVGNYLKFFVFLPGAVIGPWLGDLLRDTIPGGGNGNGDWWRYFLPAFVVYVGLLFSATILTAQWRGRWRWIWLGILTALSAANSLVVSAALRA